MYKEMRDDHSVTHDEIRCQIDSRAINRYNHPTHQIQIYKTTTKRKFKTSLYIL